MKRSQELLGLAVISIQDGKDMGRVIDFIICPEKGAVEYLVIDDGIKYLGIKFLPFSHIEGVGEHAITVLNSSDALSVAELPELKALLDKDIQLKGARAVTRKGMLVGVVTDFFVDCGLGGRITGCQITPASVTAKPKVILSEQIITFGKEILVLNEEVKVAAGELFPKEGAGDAEEVSRSSTAGTTVKEEPSEAARMFEERQRQYLIGRKLSKKIDSGTGELIGDEGQIITEEILDKAKKAGKFTEVSMNTKE